MEQFGIRDAFDIAIVALMLFYLYKIMKESDTLSVFFGVLAFIALWLVTSQILEMKLIGTIMDQFMGIGLLIIVILFQDQIKRFLVQLGDHKRWRFLKKIFHHSSAKSPESARAFVMPIVYACINMSRAKTGALIVIQEAISLEPYEQTGDMINADINSRLIENIFFKNSPLHDGAMIIAHHKIVAAGCILPVSHDRNVPRSLGLRHRSALGISQATDAFAIVVSEETGNISVAYRGVLSTKLSSTELEHRLSTAIAAD